jgi:hypothetical protein
MLHEHVLECGPHVRQVVLVRAVIHEHKCVEEHA